MGREGLTAGCGEGCLSLDSQAALLKSFASRQCRYSKMLCIFGRSFGAARSRHVYEYIDISPKVATPLSMLILWNTDLANGHCTGFQQSCRIEIFIYKLPYM